MMLSLIMMNAMMLGVIVRNAIMLSELCWVSLCCVSLCECHYAECIILSVIMQSVLYWVSLCRVYNAECILLSVIMPNVIMMNVIAPQCYQTFCFDRQQCCREKLDRFPVTFLMVSLILTLEEGAYPSGAQQNRRLWSLLGNIRLVWKHSSLFQQRGKKSFVTLKWDKCRAYLVSFELDNNQKSLNFR